MMYHFAQIKALSSGVNLNGWTFYFKLIGCCRNPLNVSNSIRYSITIVQFNLSNLIGFDCSFLGHSPLSIQELWRYPQANKKKKKHANCHYSLMLTEVELLTWWHSWIRRETAGLSRKIHSMQLWVLAHPPFHWGNKKIYLDNLHFCFCLFHLFIYHI